MIDLLLEGIGSLRFGCTIAFILPALGPLVAAGRRAWVPAVGFPLIAAVVGWARFGGWWFDAAPQWALVVAALIAVATVVQMVRADTIGWVGGATIVAAVVAAWLWVPCVGEHFSEPLNNTSREPLLSLVQVVVYVTGIGVPLFALAALPVAAPGLTRLRDHRASAAVGIAITALVALTIATGLYSDLVERLTPSAA